MIKETIIAKNLLEGNTCHNCCMKIVAGCKKDITISLPKEETCEYWWAWEND